MFRELKGRAGSLARETGIWARCPVLSSDPVHDPKKSYNLLGTSVSLYRLPPWASWMINNDIVLEKFL